MNELANTFQAIFNFFDSAKICGIPITTYLIIMVVVSGIAIFVRGNK